MTQQYNNMDKETLKMLIDRYFDGRTTEEEERQIARYFASASVDDDLAEYVPYFSAMRAGDVFQESDAMELERRLGQQIDSWNKIEKRTARSARHMSMKWIAGIAAAMAVVFIMAYAAIREDRTLAVATPQDTFDNPEDAYREAERALITFSEAINEGLNKITEKEEKK